MNTVKAIFITGRDPWGEPRGGQATFAKHLLKVYKGNLAITSESDMELPVGKWISRSYGNQSVKFLSRGSSKQSKSNRPLIPARVSSYLKARQYMSKIYSLGIKNVFTDSPELLFALSRYKWESVCYRFAGVNNPVAVSRYPWLRYFGNAFEWKMMRTLQQVNPDVMIAAADQRAIDDFFNRTKSALDKTKFHHFPTRVDTTLFHSIPKDNVRSELGLPEKSLILVATGRLCWIKGWDLLLDTLAILKQSISEVLLIFVGDGEDRNKVEQNARRLRISENVIITGFLPQTKVVKYINAADVCTVASYREGWSLAMCEILACGKPIVSCDVSGAKDMVHDNINGFVLNDRNPMNFANAILNAVSLKDAQQYSLELSDRYAIKNLARDLGSIWAPLKGVGY